MKRFVFVLIIILAFGGLVVVGAKTLWSGEIGRFCKTNPSLSRFGIVDNLCTGVNEEFTLKCSYNTHTCENLIPQKNSGNYKIIITVDGKRGKGIEVDLGVNSGPTGNQYIKTTDMNGIATFKGLPPGDYFQAVNLENFPREYGNAYKTWTWSKVTIVEEKTTEMKMDLHTSH